MDSIKERDVEESYRTAFVTSSLAAYTVFARRLAEFVAGSFEEFCVFFYNSLHSDGTVLKTVGRNVSRGLYGLEGLFVNKKHRR